MADDILSQEEVDALLRGVTGEPEEATEEEGAGGVRSYDIGRQERIVRGRMPTLEIINERFARNFRIGLFNLIRRTAEISVGPVSVIKYSEFVRNLIVPTNLNLIHMPPLRGTALFVFDPNLVFLVVDNLFGGDGRYHMRVEGRDFTLAEQRIIRKMLDVVFEEYGKAWEPIHPVQLEYVRSEMNTQFANIATPTEVVVVSTFNIELGTSGGDFHICMPYSMIEPMRDQLTSTMQADRAEADERWVTEMSLQVQDAEVELVAHLGQADITLRQILDLKVGDVISLDLPEAVVAEVDGVPLFECHYGQKNGQLALKVERVLQGRERAAIAGVKR
ncbi:flagellar motor switch protein FliM [Parasulfuritortus cantonensis]|uniref:Flagellar motor switch protein FliM n=1 Tax=Parasulfuritortus cantonensis TaxID=2528202 RepID=A0A4R1B616_9PROT|nr:flagellar motor switch protein FliM [Parasulfuritortus cantonensis]TCJ13471.1 flagellar motor switch protein FliM [Parasulfuritortus cantonensis]